MILCPLENSSRRDNGVWTQQRPMITQGFGENPRIYRQFGLKGHNGIDFRAPVGTPVFAPCDGEILVADQGDNGYGLHIKVRSPAKAAELVLGHLSNVKTKLKEVKMGDLLGWTGNTGFSTGPHLHFGPRRVKWGSGNGVFAWLVEDADNGFAGYYDCMPRLITFKGTLRKGSLIN